MALGAAKIPVRLVCELRQYRKPIMQASVKDAAKSGGLQIAAAGKALLNL